MSGCGSCPSGSYDQHIGFIVGHREVDRIRIHAASRMQKADHLMGYPVSLVRADPDLRPSLLLEIRMVFQDILPFLQGHGLKFLTAFLFFHSLRPRFFNDRNQLLQFRRVRHNIISIKSMDENTL